MTCTALEAVGVGFTAGYDQGRPLEVLDSIDLSFVAGAIALLSGPTGAGKSTLLHLLGGLLRPTEGEILADGEPVSRWTAEHRDRWRRRVGILFQGAELLEDLTAGENVLMPLVPRPGPLIAKEGAVRRILTSLGDASHAGRPVMELSGGERQRIALARALVAEPAVLLLDEPTAHQDDARATEILKIIASAKTRGALVVVASHDPRVTGSGFADTIHQLEGGRLLRPPAASREPSR